MGYILTLGLLLLGKKPKKFHKAWFFEVAPNWGGFEMGTMFVRDTTSGDSLNVHEYGHTFQNALLGPLFIVLVQIPSAIRYWWIRLNKKEIDYYRIWFEGNASEIGFAVIE